MCRRCRICNQRVTLYTMRPISSRSNNASSTNKILSKFNRRTRKKPQRMSADDSSSNEPMAPTSSAPTRLQEMREFHSTRFNNDESESLDQLGLSSRDEEQVQAKAAIDISDGDDDNDNNDPDGNDNEMRNERSLSKEKSAFAQRLSQRKTHPLNLSWHDINYWVPVKGGHKHVLKNVSAVASSGKIMAIMGPSGSGKTSLLNVLASRAAGVTRGTILINDKTFGRQLRRVAGYVLQEDLLFSYLTVRETLMYAARLRLPSSVTYEQKQELVQGIIEELGLIKCADTIVGSPMRRGISGGEKKRLSIGCELVVDPRILFLDEPTSGLDSTTALSLVETLKAIAATGRTVVCTIHQPRSGIFQLFDTLLLLASGEVAYFGDASKAVSYFASKGFKCPTYTNPADFFLDITSIDSRSETAIAESTTQQNALVSEFAKVASKQPSQRSAMPSQVELPPPSEAGFFAQMCVLTSRAAKNVYRDKTRTVFKVLQSLIVGLVIAFIYFRLPDDMNSIQDRGGLLFFVLINQSFAGLQGSVIAFIEEREIVAKERSQGYYRVLPYFLAKSLAEFPLSLVPVVFSTILYWTCNLNATPKAYGMFVLIIYLGTFLAESIGLTIAALAPSLFVANAFGPLVLVFFMIFGGFFLKTSSVPDWFIWLKYWSFIKYAYEALVINEFDGRVIPGAVVGGRLVPDTDGREVVLQYGMDPDFLWWDVLIIGGMSIAYRVLAYLFLRFLRGPSKVDVVVPLGVDERYPPPKDKRKSKNSAAADFNV